MTDAELLQQCKDEIARDLLYSDWEVLLDANPDDTYWKDTQYDRAASLAIKKAREEERESWFEKGYLSGAFRAAHESWKEAYDNELTAPGR